MSTRSRSLLFSSATGIAGVALLAVLWEGYKALGPAEGLRIAAVEGERGSGVMVLPRTDDVAMPHLIDMLVRLLEPVSSSAADTPLWLAVVQAASLSLGIALCGLAIGLVVGTVLAVAMQRVRIVESAVLPLVILSQTVPLIALAPLVRSWGARIEIGEFEWQNWMSVAVIAAYLAFFPIAVGMLRGLQSPSAVDVELMDSLASGWWSTLVRLRLPAAVPYLVPALKLAGASAVVGTVVAEVSVGLPGGIGRMIMEFAGFVSSDPAKVWAPITGALLLGLVVAGLVALAGLPLNRFRRTELAS